MKEKEYIKNLEIFTNEEGLIGLREKDTKEVLLGAMYGKLFMYVEEDEIHLSLLKKDGKEQIVNFEQFIRQKDDILKHSPRKYAVATELVTLRKALFDLEERKLITALGYSEIKKYEKGYTFACINASNAHKFKVEEPLLEKFAYTRNLKIPVSKDEEYKDLILIKLNNSLLDPEYVFVNCKTGKQVEHPKIKKAEVKNGIIDFSYIGRKK